MKLPIEFVMIATLVCALMTNGCGRMGGKKIYSIHLHNKTDREITSSHFTIGDYTGAAFHLQVGSGGVVQIVAGLLPPKQATIYWTFENGESYQATIDILEDLSRSGFSINFYIIDDTTVTYEVEYDP